MDRTLDNFIENKQISFVYSTVKYLIQMGEEFLTISGEQRSGRGRQRKGKKGEKSRWRDGHPDRSQAVENRRGDRQRRGSTGTIEEVVTNKVAGEWIRVADLKSDGPPLFAAIVW